MSTIKIVASVANAVQFVWAIYVLFDEGIPDAEEEMLIFLLLTTVPVLVLAAIWWQEDEELAELKRKRRILEEETKVRELEKKLK